MTMSLCLICCNNTNQIKEVEQPNIVFILADDLGYGDLGCYGQKRIMTPRIDQLANDGMLFTQFYAGATVCAPSRSALLTGQHTGHTYIRGNKEFVPEGQEPLADSVQTFAQLLQKAGYTTGAFGKWGLGMVGTSGAPDRKGFDIFYGYNCQRQSHRYYPTHLWYNDKRIELEGNNLTHKTVYAPTLIQEQALAFIEANKNRPFFLFLPTVLPHAELQIPDDAHYRKYANHFEENPYNGDDYGAKATVGGYASIDKPRATFAAMVSLLDDHVGQVMDKLSELGLSENTIILFSSDNGPHREGGADPGFFNSSGGFRGTKRDLYEGGIRVPFIVRWPGKISRGVKNDFVGAFWDIMPTLIEFSGAEHPRYTDGISIVPTLLGSGDKQTQHAYLYWEFHENGGSQAVRKGNWKAVRLQAKGNPKSPVALYDLNNDPKESLNVATQYPDLVDELAGYMEHAHQESEIFVF